MATHTHTIVPVDNDHNDAHPGPIKFDGKDTIYSSISCSQGCANMAHRCFFADGLKEFRRTHDINDNVIIWFFAASKDTSFEVDIMGPILRKKCRRPIVTTRRHIFTADVTQDMMEHTNLW
ncbi:hypothetical protein JHK86_018278 [Glycine max]|nr:hypothetical protein JHK86_018278 [Glycine max]